MTTSASQKKLVLAFRHGQTDWNREGRVQGHLDVPLNDNGRDQARKLASVAQKLGLQHILTSDLSRARESAELVAHGSSILVQSDERLREIFLGKAQGLTRTEIEATFGADLSKNLLDRPLSDADVSALGSEPGHGVFDRATAAICDVFAANPHVDVLGISTHGGVMKHLLYHSHHEETGRLIDQVGWIANCALYPLELDLATRRWVCRTRMAWPL